MDARDAPAAFDAKRRARLTVVVLAAGSGRRLGLGPKAHVTLGDETFFARIVRTCRDAGLDTIYAVGRTDDARISAACAALGARLVINSEPARGMSSSVSVGLEHATRGGLAGGVLVHPVDFPLVQASTVRLLDGALAEKDSTSEMWVRPVFEGRGGHPIALGSRLVARVLALGPVVPLRDALQRLGAACVDVACDDRGVVTDVDLPGDLVAARRATP